MNIKINTSTKMMMRKTRMIKTRNINNFLYNFFRNPHNNDTVLLNSLCTNAMQTKS